MNKTKPCFRGVYILVAEIFNSNKYICREFSNSAMKKLKQGNGLESDGYN